MSDAKKTLHLPPIIPVFPLSRVILIPGSSLPLKIFEPRYVQMVRDAASGNGLIGMIQPLAHEDNVEKPDLHTIGCVGKIEELNEAGSNQYLIKLRGLARFEIEDELSVTTLYRQVQVNWHRYHDYASPDTGAAPERRTLLATLTAYLEKRGLTADFETISEAPDDVLVNTLSMIVPFGVPEKQALLEVETVSDRARMLQAMLQMTLAGGDTPDGPKQMH